MKKKFVKYTISIVDKTERQFSDSYYSRKLPNGEYIDRHWLIYSTLNDRVYCFCCMLFPSHEEKTRISSLATVGINDWKHLSKSLKSHEISHAHITSLRDWSELKFRLGEQETLDKAHQRIIEKEKNIGEKFLDVLLYPYII